MTVAGLKNTRWALVALLLPLGWGCTLALGIDGNYHGLGGGGSGASSASSTSSSTTGSTGSSSSTSNSGSSGTGGSCPAGEVMQGGACVVPCDAGATACDGGCVDTTTDRANCGACGKTCTGTDVCTASACAPPHCASTLTFATFTQYSASSYPTNVSIADLNGDGKADLVVATGAHNLQTGEVYQVEVFINKGDGTFNTGVPYAIPYDSVTVGDLNGDGKPEIVVASSSADTVTVLLNSGTGTFTAQTPIPVTVGMNTVAVGDVSGDGKADILLFGNASLTPLINQGNGTFTVGAVNSSFVGNLMAVGDLNGDGKTDVVGGSGGYNDVYVYLNKGDGTFLAAAKYTSMAAITGMSLVSWRGAGATDILCAGTADTVLLNSGTGTFASQLTLASPPSFTAVADMNGDGKADLVGVLQSGSNNAVDVWLNGGDNTFTNLVSAPVVQDGITVQVGDLNGDGFLDLVALSQPTSESGSLSVVLNTCMP